MNTARRDQTKHGTAAWRGEPSLSAPSRALFVQGKVASFRVTGMPNPTVTASERQIGRLFACCSGGLFLVVIALLALAM